MSDIYVTRQPIFDRADTAVAYELRYRECDDGRDPFASSYLDGSFELLRSSLPAWVRVNREQLVGGIFDSTEASALTLLVPPDLNVDDEVVAAVTKLAARSVRLALDDFDLPEDSAAPIFRLLRPAAMVRIDMRCRSLPSFSSMVKTLKAMGKNVAADHVEDTPLHRACLAAGFDTFQGPHFSHPEPLPSAALPASTATALRLLSLAGDANTSDRELEATISADPGITYQLLRIVNSAAVGGHGITSIPHALRLVGRTNLVSWLSLASATSHSGSRGAADELIRQAVQRARFCESLAGSSGKLDKGTLFLMGLFSLLDVVFRIPMIQILDRINLSTEVKEALLDRSGPYADPLILVESYELGLWEGVLAAAERLGIHPENLARYYGDSVWWASEQMPTESRSVWLGRTEKAGGRSREPARNARATFSSA
jgi:EAL and modified HD-GYP domain-containing signal transduction protein